MRAWHREHPEIGGAATPLAEAFKLGARVFGGLLDGDEDRPGGGQR